LKDQSPLKISIDLGENKRDPAEFRDSVVLAERLGFDVVWLGDHFMPWTHSGNRSAYVWSLLGACLERTRRIKVGPYVTSPLNGRYHPAIIAQASATLDNMYPTRFLLGVGTGEAMNEVPFMNRWPAWQERMDRLVEAITLMRKFWTSKAYFDFDSKYFPMKQVYLYTKPKSRILIFFSAVGPKAAHYAGEYGDNLVTLTSDNPLERCRDTIFPSFEAGAEAAGKNPAKMGKTVCLNFTFEVEKAYLKRARKNSGHLVDRSWDMADPRKIEALSGTVSDEKLLRSIYFCSGWEELIDLISKFHEIGATEVSLFCNDQNTLRTYARRVLPHFKG
jgi:coenzyme F420-dependent glucose-6-phosphate dehydrogenase